jgi:hypothetical protein
MTPPLPPIPSALVNNRTGITHGYLLLNGFCVKKLLPAGAALSAR